MKKILVFCSSSDEVAPIFFSEIELLAKGLAEAGYGVVYGGAQCGLMGKLADVTLEHGGHVTGVIPTYLKKPGVLHEGLSELHEVDDLLDRKKIMLSMCDGIVCFPGGVGTLDEVTEIMALKQLSETDKPLAMLNLMDFWTPFLTYLDELKQQKMISQNFEELFQVFPSSEDTVTYMQRQLHS